MGEKGGKNGYIKGGGGGEGTSTFIRNSISIINSRLQSSTLQLIMAVTSSTSSSWTHKKLVKTVTMDELTLISWLETRHLLASDRTCPIQDFNLQLFN